MLKLYYYPVGFSLAAHILLEESGTNYDATEVGFGDPAKMNAYRKINPRGLVPALQLEDGEVLTENVAILPYLSKRFGFWPADPVAEARAMSLLGYFAPAVATAAAQMSHPERHTVDAHGISAVQEAGLNAFRSHLAAIDTKLQERRWLIDAYSACDAYAFAFYVYGVHKGLATDTLRAYRAHKDRMLERDAVRTVLDYIGVELPSGR